MKTILVVDDEPQIAGIARDYLRLAGFDVIVAGDGVRALEAARGRHPDLVVLDLGLPGLDGMDVARALRRDSDVPIIMLTARVEEDDRLRGWRSAPTTTSPSRSARASWWPASARCCGGARGGTSTATSCASPTWSSTSRRMSVRRGGEPIDLTPTELQILATLARHPGRVFTRAQLLDAARGADAEAYDRAIDSHVKNIRRKLEPDPHAPRYLETVYGLGYRLVDE